LRVQRSRFKQIGNTRKKEYYTHFEEREARIKSFGLARWKDAQDSTYEAYKDLKVPAQFLFIWNCFLDLYYSTETISYTDIDAYQKTNKIELTIKEVKLIRSMAMWANGEKNKALDGEE
jgi:hypothetical protein